MCPSADTSILEGLEAAAISRPSASNRNLFAKAAVLRKNWEFSRRGLARLGKDRDPLLFNDSLLFKRYQDWANGSGVYPKTDEVE